MAKGLKIMNAMASLMANSKPSKVKPVADEMDDSLNPKAGLKLKGKKNLVKKAKFPGLAPLDSDE